MTETRNSSHPTLVAQTPNINHRGYSPENTYLFVIVTWVILESTAKKTCLLFTVSKKTQQ